MEELLTILLLIDNFCKTLNYDIISFSIDGNIYKVVIETFCEKEDCVENIKSGLVEIGCRSIKLLNIETLDRRNYLITFTFRK